MRYLRRSLDTSHPTDEPYVMGDDEVFLTQRVTYATLLATGVVSTLTVLLFQLSQLAWPNFFTHTAVVFMNTTFMLPLITLLCASLLLYLAIHLTTGVNRIGVRAIAQIFQFPRIHDPRYDYHTETMARLARFKRHSYRLNPGLNAHMLQPRSGLLSHFMITLTGGFIVSSLLTYWLYSCVNEAVAIGIGLALYLGWSIYVAKRVQFELTVRILAPTTIRSFVNELREEWHTNEQFQSVLTDVLNYAGVLHNLHVYAHLLLVETLTDRVNVAVLPHASDDFLPQIAALPPDMQRSIERLLIFSMLIDGHFTSQERKRLQKLQDYKLLTYSLDDVNQLRDDYVAGKGLWL